MPALESHTESCSIFYFTAGSFHQVLCLPEVAAVLCVAVTHDFLLLHMAFHCVIQYTTHCWADMNIFLCIFFLALVGKACLAIINISGDFQSGCFKLPFALAPRLPHVARMKRCLVILFHYRRPDISLWFYSLNSFPILTCHWIIFFCKRLFRSFAHFETSGLLPSCLWKLILCF